MSKNNIGKKLLALAAIGAAIGGVIAFFKKFEKEDEDDFDFNSFQVPTGSECCDADSSRNYTTIAGEKEDSDDSEADDKAQDDQDEALNDDGETPDSQNETSDEEKTEKTESAETDK